MSLQAAWVTRVCHHEAAHALAALTIGVPVLYVEILMDGPDLGHCAVDPTIRYAECGQVAIFLLAGPLAANRFDPNAAPVVHYGGGANDYAMVRTLLAVDGPAWRMRRAIGIAEARACRLVDQFWEDITLVARYLARDGRLDGDQLWTLLTTRRLS